MLAKYGNVTVSGKASMSNASKVRTRLASKGQAMDSRLSRMSFPLLMYFHGIPSLNST
jgi:hypothetical protein